MILPTYLTGDLIPIVIDFRLSGFEAFLKSSDSVATLESFNVVTE